MQTGKPDSSDNH